MAALIRQATRDDLSAVRKLLWDYRALLIERTAHLPGLVDEYYAEESFRALLDALPGVHVPPDGILLVAALDGTVVACGMTQRIAPDTCEIKRVFVAPAGRGQGIARDLCSAVLAWMAQAGYSRAVLDTMSTLTEAIALYHSLGFSPCAPYHAEPGKYPSHVFYFAKPLTDQATTTDPQPR